ncbi:glycoside hydrolase family 3 protein [Ligilactobacillus acidipiscis]|uniref:glycoside hydrolase family 3 protein n=1 Tax=Ligilactobacillus acidipiscis TaxID=89059 RepID=UPI0023F6916C|nr:glycoside hydrolase family 3 protein [Ligilactobacillus acidipiscis]WEV57017.1 glycoside hydrolase family 3 C-terminal domain-containing protein [Ligilactobacillus acidipiscis]
MAVDVIVFTYDRSDLMVRERPSNSKLIFVWFLSILAIIIGIIVGNQWKVNAADTSSQPTVIEKANSALSTKIATDGTVLLQNNQQTLPLQKGQKVALYGYGAYATSTDGTGSGAVNNRENVSIQTGLEGANVNIINDLWLRSSKAQYEKLLGDQDPRSFKYSDPEISQNDVDRNRADVGIYVLTRISGEGADRTNTAGDYQLTANEYKNIKKISENYKHSVVLLNVGGIIDTHFVESIKNLDSVVLVSQGGETAGSAVANILTGKTDPSGKLTDTWAMNYSDYPSSATFANNDNNGNLENYSEGIYVGYRYFDTYNVTPRYSFGYGKSYTSFDIKARNVSVYNNKVHVLAQVKNTGNKYSGREVVQLYYSAPKGQVSTAFQNLGAYIKTRNLRPGQSQFVDLKLPLKKMASYNNKSASYELNKGSYLIRLGNSSRNTHVIADINLTNKVTTQKLSNQDEPAIDPTTLKGNEKTWIPVNQQEDLKTAKKFYVNPWRLSLIDGDKSNVKQKKVSTYLARGRDPESVKKDGAVQKIIPIRTKKNATLKDVYDHKVSLNSFVAGMSNEQLANLVQRNRNTADQSYSVKGVVWQTAANYVKELGIPVMNLSDGPAGLRITNKYTENGKTYYQYATAWPIETLVAQTWDPVDIQKMGQGAAIEMKHFGISNILGPAENIHRNPLGGRNFEYYSEDPLIAGDSAANMVKGVQSVPGETASIKHFAANNQETNRLKSNSVIGEQALREIYLRNFQITVQESQPQLVMSSYNKINGTYTNSSSSLLVNILRNEWGFKGTVITDYGPTQAKDHPEQIIGSGNALLMPSERQAPDPYNKILQSVNSSDKESLQLGYLQLAAKQVLTSIMNSREFANYYHVPARPYARLSNSKW